MAYLSITSAALLGIIFLLLAGIHIYWSFGGKWAVNGIFPENKQGKIVISPGILSYIIVVGGLLALSFFSFFRANIISINLPDFIEKYGMLFIAFIFFTRAIGEFNFVGLFKKVKGTLFALKDNTYYIPLCLIIAFLAILNQLYR